MIPALHILDRLRKLEGSAFVTYPTGKDTSDKRVERYLTVEIDDARATPDWVSTDEEHTECVLVDHQIVGYDESQQHVGIYVRYEKLPATAWSIQRVNARGDVETVTFQRVPIGTSASANSLLQTSSIVESEDGRVATKVTVTVASHSALLSREMDARAQGAFSTTTDNIVSPAASDPPLTHLTVGFTRTPIDSAKSREIISTIASFPTLRSSELDPIYLVPTNIDRTIIAASSSHQASKTSGITAPQDEVIEYQALDKYRSVQIVAKMPTTPTERTWYEIGQHSFPDVLLSYNVSLQISAYGGTIEFDTDFAYNLNQIPTPVLHTNIQEGYSGPVRMRVTETFFRNSDGDPPDEGDIPTPTVWWPQSHQLTLSYSTTIVAGAIVGVGRGVIPSCLHGAISDSNIVETIAATYPATLPYGEWIVKDCRCERWRFGMWRIMKYEMFVPANTAP